jgi:vesicular inhibitory amino acid transporter
MRCYSYLGPVELFLIAFFALAAAFVGTKLGTCWVILEERWPEFREQVRDPYPSIAEKAVGPWMR